MPKLNRSVVIERLRCAQIVHEKMMKVSAIKTLDALQVVYDQIMCSPNNFKE
jgi:hypothetical protein